MKSRLVIRLVSCTFSIVTVIVSVHLANAQSTLLDFPTPVSTNELSGTIKPRDIGDSRVTTYYYWFEGSQGDVFINLVTKNFAGDVDLFVQNGQKPLTKIVVYPDFGEVETGRVIYLRKPEKLLLRVQGRTPNDEAAQFRMKFAGSFVAVSGQDDPEIPKVSSDVTGNVRVNSVGTILPPIQKPVKVESQAGVTALEDAEKKADQERSKAATEPETTKSEPVETKEAPKLGVVVTDELPKTITAKTPVTRKTPSRVTRSNRSATRTPPPPKEVPVADKDEKKETSADTTETKASETDTKASDIKEKPKADVASKADPLENVQLVIVFKDGRKIERPLTEVLKFSVDRGVLTVISKTGRIGKYSMIDVAKVTIE